MKLRILFLSVCTVALGATAWYAYNGDSLEASSAYIPRSEFKNAQGIDGAMEYYKMVKSNIYTGEIEAEDVIKLRRAVQEMDRLGIAKDENLSWTSLGPNNVGGRTRGMTAYPNDPTKLLAGGISGGLFRSTDSGNSWQLLSGFKDAIGVSSIAVLENGNIYVATGHSREGNYSGSGSSAFMGAGLYRSTDDGQTFNVVNDFEPQPWDPASNWSITNVIMADPSNPNRLWVGTNFGLYPYTDGATELGALPPGLFPVRVEDFVISASGKNIMVALGPKYYVSSDFGATFTNVNNGPLDFGTTEAVSSTDLAVDPNNEEFFYASISGSGNRLKGIYTTQNLGQTWNVIAPSNENGDSPFAPFGDNAQGYYDNTITVLPTGPGEDLKVIMGGIKLYKWQSPVGTTPGISLWENINDNFASAPGLPPSPIYVHSDIQNSYLDDLGNLYITTDGGVFKTTNGGSTWTSMNANYSTTQYYAIAFNPDGQVLGGLQDNGTLWLTNSVSAGQASQFTGGDGFSCEISQEFPNYMFSTIYNGAVFRSTDGGANVSALGDLAEVSNGGGSDFTTDIALHENADNQFSQIYVNYIPTIIDPNLVLYDTPVATENGDTIIGAVPASTQIYVDASNSDYMLTKVLDDSLFFYSYYVRNVGGEDVVYHNVGDTTTVQETPQFMMAAALSNGVYITREPMKTNGVPEWNKMSNDGGNPTCIEFSPDGNHLYVGFGSTLVRYSGLNDAWTDNELNVSGSEYAIERTIIYQGSAVITDIEVDYSQGRGTTAGQPDASERVVISLGNYGGSGKIRVSDVAASTTQTSTFANIWNVSSDITGMPCYSVVMDVREPNKIIAGTEHGLWYTDNNGSTWANVNNGDMVRVPVFDLRQQKYENWKVDNSGVVYAGTHGRGIFYSDYFLNPNTGIEDIYTDATPLSDLIVYPNPASSNATLRYTMAKSGKVDMHIYSLDGRLIDAKAGLTVEAGKDRTMPLNIADLPNGTYLVQLTTDQESKTIKFVKSK